MNKIGTGILPVIIAAVLLLLASCGRGKTADIVKDGISDYRIIISATATKEERESAALIRSVIERSTGVRLDLTDDWLKGGETAGEHEIVVGNTNRGGAENKIMSYSVTEHGGKIFITGNGAGTVMAAAVRFLELCTGYDAEKGEPEKRASVGIKQGVTIVENAVIAVTHGKPECGKVTDTGLENGGYILKIREDGGVSVLRDGKEISRSDTPAVIRTIGRSGNEGEYACAYGNAIRTESGFSAFAEVKTAAGSVFLVRDDWYPTAGGTFSFDRTVSVTSSTPSEAGFASAVLFSDATPDGSCDRDGYDYFIPGVLYRDTEYMQTTNPWGKSLASDFSGKHNYVKELCVTLPSAMARNRKNGNCLMLVHLTPDVSIELPGENDITVSDEVRYGSVGYTFGQTLSVGFVYPSSEGPVTYEHEGSRWRKKYNVLSAGNSHKYSISLIPGISDSYQKAMTESYKKAFSLYSPKVADNININKVYSEQLKIYEAFYTEYSSPDGIKSAGLYFDASVRTGRPYSPVSYLAGFSGAQTSAAYEMLREGVLSGNRSIIAKGSAMLDFWSSDKINENELPVVWWVPDGNSRTGGSIQGYADYLRVVVDSVEGIADACIFGKKNGLDITVWQKAAVKTADFLVKNQDGDGTWSRAYRRSGATIMTDGSLENFDQSMIWSGFDGKSRLASYCAVRFLAKMYTLTGNAKYRDAAIRTAEWAYDTMYLEIGKYVSICPDHVNVVDKESAIYAMYCFSTAYDLTGEEKYREALEHAAVSAMSFVYVYDYAVPYSAGSDYDAVNVFKNGGVIGQSVIATGWGAVDAYAACTYFDFFDYWVMTGDSTFLDFAKFIQNNTKITASDSETGWYLPGMNLEACNVSGNVFSTAGDGVWLPWISHSFVDPIIDMRDRYGNADVTALADRYSREELSRLRNSGT